MSVRLQEMTASLTAAQTSCEMRGCGCTLSAFVSLQLPPPICHCPCVCVHVRLLVFLLCGCDVTLTRLCNLLKSVLF